MDKKLFKGIQQVTMAKYNAAEQKKGYLWFVREPQGEDSNLDNDRFYIYFGTKCYGSFSQGELPAMAAALNAIKESIGLDDDFKFLFEEATTVVEAFDKVKGWYDALAQRVLDVENSKADKTALADYVTDVEYVDGKISFKNAEGTEVTWLSATPFIKDGMLSAVKVVTIEKDDEGNIPEGTVEGEKYIKFTWNTDGGNTEEYIRTSEIGAIYEAGAGLKLDNTKFNVCIDEQYLAVNDKNEITISESCINGIESAIKGIKVNDVSLEPDGDKIVNIDVKGTNVPVGIDIKGAVKDEEGNVSEETIYAETTSLAAVLQGIQNSVSVAVSGGLAGVVAGNGIDVTPVASNTQTVSVMVSAAEGNMITVGADGVYAAMYYEGDDIETE